MKKICLEMTELHQGQGSGMIQRGNDPERHQDDANSVENVYSESLVGEGICGVLWVHCASVGEFEQARPIIEGYKEKNGEAKIVVTFFSPSGYELRKNYPLADKVFYLPMDTHRNAVRFIETVKPTTAIFIKYEFWRNYLAVLKQRKIPTYLVSGIFREDQRFFKWWGGSFRRMLSAFTHFFIQDDKSLELLNSVGLSNTTVSGDTRFDRVYKVAQESKDIKIVADFIADATTPVIIVGSSWTADEEIISAGRLKLPLFKLVVAPHEIGERHLGKLNELFGGQSIARYTAIEKSNNKETDNDENYDSQLSAGKVLVVDTIGLLSSIYKYGSIAYIGGGFGAGIHNILEAAVYGIPVVFGPKYHKFKEARDLIALGGAFFVSNGEEYLIIMEKLLSNEPFRKESGAICKKYVEDNLGATGRILEQVL